MDSPIQTVTRFFTAVEHRDPVRVASCFTADVSFRNMPHPPVIGRAGIEALFRPILSRSTRVEWVIHSLIASGQHVFAERTDRFWIDGVEYHIECNGVFRVDAGQPLIAEVRDYMDLGLWHQRLGDVLTASGSPA